IYPYRHVNKYQIILIRCFYCCCTFSVIIFKSPYKTRTFFGKLVYRSQKVLKLFYNWRIQLILQFYDIELCKVIDTCVHILAKVIKGLLLLPFVNMDKALRLQASKSLSLLFYLNK